jgi:hypothetical protein
MSRRRAASSLVVGIVCCSIACADRSPLAPDSSPATSESLSARPGAAATGLYELSFRAVINGTLQPVSSLTVMSQELILAARVTDAAGNTATSGTITFDYCSYKGLPPNDITRADEAPLEACRDGSADWARLTAIRLDTSGCPRLGPGYACMDFGIVRIPRTIGFRFRYSAQRSGIASGTSDPQNFQWTAQ